MRFAAPASRRSVSPRRRKRSERSRRPKSMSAAVVSRGPLWAQPGDAEQQPLPLWRALLIALGMEIILPFLLLGVNWSVLQFWQEPPPQPVVSVRLHPAPP